MTPGPWPAGCGTCPRGRPGRATCWAALDALAPDGPEALAPGFELSAAVLRHLQADPLLPAELLPADWPGGRCAPTYDEWDARYRATLKRLEPGRLAQASDARLGNVIAMDVEIAFTGVPVIGPGHRAGLLRAPPRRPADVEVAEDEVMWRVAEAAWLYVVVDPPGPGTGWPRSRSADLDATLVELADRGIIPVASRRSGGARKATVLDPDGNTVAVIEVPPSRPAAFSHTEMWLRLSLVNGERSQSFQRSSNDIPRAGPSGRARRARRSGTARRTSRPCRPGSSSGGRPSAA